MTTTKPTPVNSSPRCHCTGWGHSTVCCTKQQHPIPRLCPLSHSNGIPDGNNWFSHPAGICHLPYRHSHCHRRPRGRLLGLLALRTNLASVRGRSPSLMGEFGKVCGGWRLSRWGNSYRSLLGIHAFLELIFLALERIERTRALSVI